MRWQQMQRVVPFLFIHSVNRWGETSIRWVEGSPLKTSKSFPALARILNVKKENCEIDS